MLADLLGEVVDLVILTKIYKKPPTRGYLVHYEQVEESGIYGVLTGNGYLQRLEESQVIHIHKNYIIIEK